MSRGGGQINYREEEKKILDSILGKDVYDNRIRPSGLNGTGKTVCLRTLSFHSSTKQGFLKQTKRIFVEKIGKAGGYSKPKFEFDLKKLLFSVRRSSYISKA
jgi:ABC-type molybdenum transport system ATPase subunit/photorepair protein PhrA